MKLRVNCVAILLVALFVCPLSIFGGDVKKKEEVVASIEKHKAELTGLSDQIWAFAETALRETRSSKVLADYAEKQGFEVKRGVSGMPTAFVASYGQGRPIIGILGEFDALPGISQKASTTKEPLEAGAPGHGCGHNLFGAASLGAAVAIKELIAAGKLKGTIRFYGTPAEEDVGGKVYMARDGMFNDLDVCLAWHPDDRTRADTQSSQAIVTFTVEFKGKASHAAADPWNGRSALAGLEFFTTGLNRMREFVKPSGAHALHGAEGRRCSQRRAGICESAGVAARFQAHGSRRAFGSRAQNSRRRCVDGRGRIEALDCGRRLRIAGQHGGRTVDSLESHMAWAYQYTNEEQEFARAIQRATGVEVQRIERRDSAAGRA